MDIRLLKETDVLECLELLKQLTVSGIDFDYKTVFQQISSNNNIYIYVVILDDKIVGMATILIEQKFIRLGNRVGHIEDVVVSSHHRNLGIGKILIEKCIQTAKERECYKVILDCDDKNVSFYSKLGFKDSGTCMRIDL
jgi:glucosamine-phosphate N-acetyltransferase